MIVLNIAQNFHIEAYTLSLWMNFEFCEQSFFFSRIDLIFKCTQIYVSKLTILIYWISWYLFLKYYTLTFITYALYVKTKSLKAKKFIRFLTDIDSQKCIPKIENLDGSGNLKIPTPWWATMTANPIFRHILFIFTKKYTTCDTIMVSECWRCLTSAVHQECLRKRVLMTSSCAK